MRATVLTALLLVAAAGCRKTNGAYCGAERPCAGGFACDLTAHECHAIVGRADMAMSGDLAPSPCGSCAATMPICVAPTCMACTTQSDPEGACTANSPSTPHCLTTGQDAGSCVGCRDIADCTDPAKAFCDTTTHQCRGCNSDSDCMSSLVCDMTPNGGNRGKCIPMSDVVYVDGTASTGGSGLTPSSPLQKIMDGINKAWMTGVNRHYVHIATATYNENIVVNSGKSITLVGPTSAVVHFTGGNDALGVAGGGTLVVRGLTATGGNGNGAGCNGASFTAYGTYFLSSSQSGIYANGCNLLVDGCWFNGNSSGGILIAGGDFQVYNSIFSHNTGDGGLYQNVKGNTTLFVNNTVADNVGGIVGGVKCDTTGNLVVKNSILFNNRGGAGIAETDCQTSGSASDDPTGSLTAAVKLTGGVTPGFTGSTPVGPQSYHLTAGSVCIDKIPAAGGPDHDYDLQSRPDTNDGMIDIGADEYYP